MENQTIIETNCFNKLLVDSENQKRFYIKKDNYFIETFEANTIQEAKKHFYEINNKQTKKINFVIDIEKVKINAGINFEDFSNYDFYNYLLDQLEFLRDHNKNYNKVQYWKINDLYEILKAIKAED